MGLLTIPVTDEVSRIISGSHPKTSTDNNNLSVQLIKVSYRHILTPLKQTMHPLPTVIFQLAETRKHYTPIFKKSEANLPENYESISILSVFRKIIEKAFLDRLLGFLNRLQLFSEKQFGFRENLSRIDAINKLEDDISEGLGAMEHVIIVFLDLFKAFDCVHHRL